MDQVRLAHEIGVHRSTMNGYERGTRGMDEATLERISLALDCTPIEIWEDAFNIFRYNFFREQAAKTGVSTEELMAGIHSRLSTEQIIQTSLQALFDDLSKLFGGVLAFLGPDRQPDGRTQIPAWGVVVPSEAQGKRKRALKLQRSKPKAPRRQQPYPPLKGSI